MEYNDLTALLRSHKNDQIVDGCSGVKVYHLPELSAYLKIGEAGKIYDLRRERTALSWLAGRLSVPKILGFEAGDEGEALLISEIAGVPASTYVSTDGADAARLTGFVTTAAIAMRRIHGIDIRDCPLDQRLDAKLEKALENIRKGLVDTEDFDPENAGRSPKELYSEILDERPDNEDLVFTHGDFCLPNIIVKGDTIAGLIDLGSAGVADRYQDIALLERSFRYNLRVEIDFEQMFCKAYGIERLDRQKLEFYRKLDELF